MLFRKGNLGLTGFYVPLLPKPRIEQIKDLKGKRVAWIVGSGGINLYMKAYLAFANLTWEDVEIVKFPGYTPSIRGLMEGAVDAAMASSGGPISYELDSSPKGMRYIILPFSDKDGWKRIRKVYPLVDQTLCSVGAAIDPKKPVEIGTAAGPTWVTLDKLDKGKAYWITKLVAGSYECSEHPDWWAPKASIGAARSAPFHPGSVKYFEKIGIWSEQQIKRDQGFFKQQKETIAAFKKAKIEAKKKGMDKDTFKKYWNSVRP